jgi:hypothetical protein
MRGDPAFWATFSLQLVTKLQTTVANDDFDWYVSSLLKGVKIGVPSIVVVSTVLTTVFLYRSTVNLALNTLDGMSNWIIVGPELRAVDWANHAGDIFGRVGQSLQRLRVV